MRVNSMQVGDRVAAQVPCKLTTKSGRCFERESLSGQVHIACWDMLFQQDRDRFKKELEEVELSIEQRLQKLEKAVFG